MKHIILFIKMIIYYPAIILSSLHIRRKDFDMNQISAKMWSTILLKMVKVKTEVKHINHIPLEDGFIFLTNLKNPYDSLILLSIFPINISFILDQTTRIPFIKNWFKRINALFISKHFDFIKHIDDVEKLMHKSGNLIIYLNQLERLDVLESFFDYAYMTKKILIPLSIVGSKHVMRKGSYHKAKLDICLPLHHEEYQYLSHKACLIEIRDRIKHASI